MSKTAVITGGGDESEFGKYRIYSLLDAMILDPNTVIEDITKKNISLKSELKTNIVPIIHSYIYDHYVDNDLNLVATEFQPIELKNTQFENNKLMYELTFDFDPMSGNTSEDDSCGFIKRYTYYRTDRSSVKIITDNFINTNVSSPDNVDGYVGIEHILGTEPPYNSCSIPAIMITITAGITHPGGADPNYTKNINPRYRVLLNDEDVGVYCCINPSYLGLYLKFPISKLPKTGTNNIKIYQTNDIIESTRALSISSHVKAPRNCMNKITVKYNDKVRYNVGGEYSYGQPSCVFINNEDITTDMIFTVEYNSDYFTSDIKEFEDTVAFMYGVDTLEIADNGREFVFADTITLIMGKGRELINEPNVRRVVEYVIPRDKILQLAKYTNPSPYGVYDLTFNDVILKKK